MVFVTASWTISNDSQGHPRKVNLTTSVTDSQNRNYKVTLKAKASNESQQDPTAVPSNSTQTRTLTFQNDVDQIVATEMDWA